MPNKAQIQDSLATHLEADNGPYLSICLQRPRIAGNTSKWDILMKNVVQRVDELDIEDSPFEERVEQALKTIDINYNHCGGWLVILTPTTTDIYEIDDTPHSVLFYSDKPYILPKVTDGTQSTKGWVLAVDRDHPGFYRFDGDALQDRTDALSYRSYDDMEDTREPMGAVNYHTNGSMPQGGGGQASAQFHALGVSTDDYDEVQMRDFLNGLAKAVESRISGTGRPLILAGDPKRVGWMKEEMELFELVDEHIDLAGDGLTTDNLTLAASKIFEGIRESALKDEDLADGAPETVSGFDGAMKAAKAGKVDTLYIMPERDGMQISDDDERLILDNIGGSKRKPKTNELVIHVLQMGGRVLMADDSLIDTDSEVFATLRY